MLPSGFIKSVKVSSLPCAFLQSAIVQAGMVGGPIGVAFASVASAITLGYDIYRNYQAQQDTVNKLQVQLDYSRERSGYSLTSGGR